MNDEKEKTPADPADFDRVMLAMDVVDTLRHQQSLVDRELSAEADDRALVEKVRRMYASQGIAVSDAVIAEAVAALREGRFAYKAPAPSWKLTLAKVYVNRGRWLKLGAAAAALVIAAFLAHQMFVVAPGERRVKEVAAIHQRLLSETKDPAAKKKAEALFAEATAATRSGDTASLKKSAEAMKQLQDAVLGAYELRIVSSPSTPSGVWRIPEANPQSRNYYIIVEAIGPDGKPVRLPITSEEDGGTRMVDTFGLRVDASVYEKVRRDKLDDGIIENRRFGEKKRGYLTPEYRFSTTGGAITQW